MTFIGFTIRRALREFLPQSKIRETKIPAGQWLPGGGGEIRYIDRGGIMKKVLLIGFLWPYLGGANESSVGQPPGRIQLAAEHSNRSAAEKASRSSPNHSDGLSRDSGRGRGCWASMKKPRWGTGERAHSGLSPGPCHFALGVRYVPRSLRLPDEHKGWIPYALSSADEFIRREKCDALLSIWPYSSHLIAQELKKRHGLPWIADLADLWSDNSAYPYGRIRKWFDTRLEKRTLGDADTLMTSSGPLAERLAWIHPQKRSA